MAVASPRLGSEATTQGIRVEVSPSYMPEHSRPTEREFVFAYRIRITNLGDEAAHLVSRRWLIVDANGTSHVVEGPGVVGQQPRLEPGQSFDYSSYCPLKTPWGTMEGSFQMRRDDGQGGEGDLHRDHGGEGEQQPDARLRQPLEQRQERHRQEPRGGEAVQNQRERLDADPRHHSHLQILASSRHQGLSSQSRACAKRCTCSVTAISDTARERARAA